MQPKNKKIAVNGPFCIDVYFHIVREDNGSGGINPNQLNNIITNLNQFYNTHEIYFSNLGYDHIDNTNFLQISGDTEAETLAQVNNLSNAINYYIVETLWNNPNGYVTGTATSIPSNRLVIRSDRILSPTSAHEVGHCLKLYHTFETFFCILLPINQTTG